MSEQKNTLPQDAAAHNAIDAIEWRQRLDAIAGLNAEVGLHRIRGNIEGYMRMLKAFVKGHAEEMTQLADALVSDDLATLKDIAHSLKGSAATIGAERLAEAATVLDAALRNKAECAEIEANTATTIAELATLIDGIRGALQL
jgi:two-component system sensor histidine kinase/response regulator